MASFVAVWLQSQSVRGGIVSAEVQLAGHNSSMGQLFAQAGGHLRGGAAEGRGEEGRGGAGRGEGTVPVQQEGRSGLQWRRQRTDPHSGLGGEASMRPSSTKGLSDRGGGASACACTSLEFAARLP